MSSIYLNWYVCTIAVYLLEREKGILRDEKKRGDYEILKDLDNCDECLV